ncbi:MAG: hypothetical protein MUW56_22280 [Chryseobacterium sp.]|nr:hypothetical protein [Chryseobacterium sp.]MCJ7936282.1 hypothetical protein [Chryseobacterium sp.]
MNSLSMIAPAFTPEIQEIHYFEEHNQNFGLKKQCLSHEFFIINPAE